MKLFTLFQPPAHKNEQDIRALISGVCSLSPHL